MDRQAIETLQTAAAQFRRGRLREAEALCRRLLARWPEAVDVLHLLALVQRAGGNSAAAEDGLRRCLALAPQRADIRANLGNLLAACDRPLEAEQAYRDALAHDPDFRPARLGLARLLNRRGEHGQAAALGRTLAAADPNDAEAWAVLGTAHRGAGSDEDAEAAWRRALHARPGYGTAHYGLAALLSDAGRSEEAQAELERAARAGVHGPEMDFTRAGILMSLGRFEEAERVLEERLRTGPRLAAHQRLLARLRYMRGAEDYAADFAAAVHAHPDDVALRLAFGQLLRGAGRLEDAREAIAAGLSARPAEPHLLVELAAVHQEAGEHAQARRSAEAALAAAPAARAPREALVDALLSLGDAASAMPLIEALRRSAPHNQWYVALEATAARGLGDPRYERWYDYARLVRSYELTPPDGWADIEAFHRDLVPVLLARHRFRRAPLDQSLRSGTQTARSLLGDPDPVIRAWLGALAAPLREYQEAIGREPDHPLTARNTGASRLSGCWSVLLAAGGYHVNHVHPEGWISSAYYVEVPDEPPDADEPHSGWLQFGAPRFPVPGATPAHRVRPHPGLLVLFPSYLWHGTTPLRAGERRLTIAFDAVPRNPT